MIKQKLTAFYVLFALSGFSGLIYESIWTHYLKLFLGHAAYAQTLVIAIFMGGMAIGAWVCSRYTMQLRNLFIGYAIVEIIIGVFALFFHNIFEQTLEFAFNTIIPNLDSPTAINLAKWGLATLLILPQTILLGMTFPLMSGAVIRSHSTAPGSSLGMLYFSNSIGAAIGVLTSGFLLIYYFGLPGTIRFAGVINVVLAVAVWVIASGMPQKTTELAEKDKSTNPRKQQHYLLLIVASMTGAASFIYEIGWIRMLSMVLSSSTHSFELMLSAFILGLALGSLFIKRYIDRTSSPLRLLAYIQIFMGVLAAATLPLYNQTFDMVLWLMYNLEANNTGYFLYMLSSNGIALLLMLPATFCAGMTLPLITSILIHEKNGEKNIGAVYAANTIGAIVGVFFAIHIGLPLLGLKNLILFGAGIDVMLGLAILSIYTLKNGIHNKPTYATAALIILLVSIGSFTDLDLYKIASGVYRKSDFLTTENSRLVYHRDGKTATVSLTMLGEDKLAIRTNGKIDASINIGGSQTQLTDDVTQVQLSVIPMALHPTARTVANIGFGSGVTASVILKNPNISLVDTIEIEPLMVEGARHFGSRVELAYNDSRSKIHIEDAKTFFAANKSRYDIIISEPSNPWVSGVSSLFTKEFYQSIIPVLEDDGVFAQWVQLYEIDMNLLATIINALSMSFGDYSIYTLDQSDLLIVAKKNGAVGSLSKEILTIPSIGEELRNVYVNGSEDMNFRKVGDKRLLQPYFNNLTNIVNSDYFPFLDQNADRVRFLKADAKSISTLNHLYLPIAEMLSDQETLDEPTHITVTPYYAFSRSGNEAVQLREYYLANSESQSASELSPLLKLEAQIVVKMCNGTFSGKTASRLATLYNQGIRLIPHLNSHELQEIFRSWEALGAKHNLSPGEYDWFALYKAISIRDGGEMKRLASRILAKGNLPTNAMDFLMASALTGALLTDEFSWANNYWSKYKVQRFIKDEIPLIFQVIEAKIDARV